MKNVYSIEHHKGGVGKTTSTYNIASAIAKKGKKVLMVDVDPQASLTLSCGYDPADFETNIYDILIGNQKARESIYQVQEMENLSIIPSINTLATYQESLNGKMARERKIKQMLKEVKEEYDYIFLDCPPQLTLLAINCIYASDYVIIPLETSALSAYILEDFINHVKTIQEELDSEVEIIGIFGTMYDVRQNSDKQILKDLQEQKDFPYLGVVPRAAAAKRGLKKGLPAILNEPKEPLSIAYQEIAEKIIKIREN